MITSVGWLPLRFSGVRPKKPKLQIDRVGTTVVDKPTGQPPHAKKAPTPARTAASRNEKKAPPTIRGVERLVPNPDSAVSNGKTEHNGEKKPHGDAHRAFAKLPVKYGHHSMPARMNKWLKHMTYTVMESAIDKADPKYIADLTNKVNPASTFYDVLDFGFGYGDFSVVAANKIHPHLNGRKVKLLGLDIASDAKDIAYWVARKGNLYKKPLKNIADYKFVLHDMLDDDVNSPVHKAIVPDNSVSLVILSSMLHLNAEDNKKLMQQVMRMLRPGGIALVTHWDKDYDGRGPLKKLRPEPHEIVQLAFMSSAYSDLEFMGYRMLPLKAGSNDLSGVYCCVLRKSTKIAQKEIDQNTHVLLNQYKTLVDDDFDINAAADGIRITPTFLQGLHQLFAPLRQLAKGNRYDEMEIFFNGLINRYLQAHPRYAEAVRYKHRNDADYRVFLDDYTRDYWNDHSEGESIPRSFSLKDLNAKQLFKLGLTPEMVGDKKYIDPAVIQTRLVLLIWLKFAAHYAKTTSNDKTLDTVIKHKLFRYIPPIPIQCQYDGTFLKTNTEGLLEETTDPELAGYTDDDDDIIDEDIEPDDSDDDGPDDVDHEGEAIYWDDLEHEEFKDRSGAYGPGRYQEAMNRNAKRRKKLRRLKRLKRLRRLRKQQKATQPS